MGPVVWWWRWWLGLDPNQQEQLEEARGLLEEQQTQADELTAQLHARNGKITQLRGQVGTLEETRAGADELRSRVAELEGAEAEVAQLRGRVAELEQVSDSADELRSEVARLRDASGEADELRSEMARLREASGEADELRAQVETLQGELEQARADAEQARADAEQVATARDEARKAAEQAQSEVEGLRTRVAGLEAQKDATAEVTGSPAAGLDIDEARAVLGTPIAADDLTAIDGIGPKITTLFGDAGIVTWRALADASDEQLREVLAGAGPRYRSYDPAPWSQQAALLADGRWQDFKDATSG